MKRWSCFGCQSVREVLRDSQPGPQLRRPSATIPMMHSHSQFTYRLFTLYSSDETFSQWEPAQHPYLGMSRSEEQTTRTLPEDFDRYSAAPAGVNGRVESPLVARKSPTPLRVIG